MVFFKKDPSKRDLIEREAPKKKDSEVKDIVEEAVKELEKMYPEGRKLPSAEKFDESDMEEHETEEMPSESYQYPDIDSYSEKDIERESIPEPEEYKEPEKRSISKVRQPSESFAPLFVKVDKYGEILSELQEIKSMLSAIKSVFPILIEVDSVKKDAMDTLRLTMQKIEKNVIELDSELLKPGQGTIEVEAPTDIGHIEDSLTQLQGQLNSLRGELKKFS